VTGTLLTVGETMALVTPFSGESIVDAETFRVDAGGAESNVAAHVAALGLPAAWFSRLGDDPLGRRVRRQLSARGVDVSAVVTDPLHPTGLYVKDPGNGVSYYRAGSAASHLGPDDVALVPLAGVGILHVSGITPALSASAHDFLDHLIGSAQEAGITVSFDVNHRAALWDIDRAATVLDAFARRADILFVGRDEAERLWGTELAVAIRSRFPDTAELVVKDAEHGATTFADDVATFEPSEVVEVVDAVGAGDAFAGGYLAARLAGATVSERLRAGHARAALTLKTTADSVDERIGQ
jgi:2-dehydro-3-deoxygluconokinase